MIAWLDERRDEVARSPRRAGILMPLAPAPALLLSSEDPAGLVLREGVRGLNATAATLRRGELKGEGEVGRLLALALAPLLLARVLADGRAEVVGGGGGTAERGDEGA